MQPSGFDQNTVGQRQDVICSISVPPGIDPELGWLNEGDIITDDSRVTIVESSNDSAGNSSYFIIITSIIQFDPLIEDDEGAYSCYSIVNETEISTSIQLQNFRSMLCVRYNMYTHIYTFILYIYTHAKKNN